MLLGPYFIPFFSALEQRQQLAASLLIACLSVARSPSSAIAIISELNAKVRSDRARACARVHITVSIFGCVHHEGAIYDGRTRCDGDDGRGRSCPFLGASCHRVFTNARFITHRTTYSSSLTTYHLVILALRSHCLSAGDASRRLGTRHT